MNLWFLCTDRYRQGFAIPFSLGRVSIGAQTTAIDFLLDPDSNEALYQSSQAASRIAYQLLWREGFIRNSITVRCRLEDSQQNFLGRSSELLFALATMVSILHRKEGYPPIAATGVVENDGWIRAVSGIVERIQAGISTLPVDGVVFYPRSNEPEIGVDLIRAAQANSIKLCPIDHLSEAAELLGIEMDGFYSEPYRGLAAFEYQHRAIFFGRQPEIFELRNRLLELESYAFPCLMVIGASGTGKSSLIRAGFIPNLEIGPLALTDRPIIWSTWRPNYATSQDETSLVRSICDAWKHEPRAKAVLLDLTAPETLLDLSEKLFKALPPENRFLFFIDQFEEFSACNYNPSLLGKFSEFIQRLVKAGVWVIGALSNRYYPFLMESPFINPFGSSNIYILPRLDSAAIGQIIEMPAARANVTWGFDCNGIRLDDRIRQDIGYENENILPLLELLLHTLYETRENGKIITFSGYEQIGGVSGCIQNLAENVFVSLSFESQSELPRLLWHLAKYAPELGIIERPVPLSEFASDDAVSPMIQAFSDARLLSIDKPLNRDAEVRLSYGALLKNWPRAKSIVDGFLIDKQLSERLSNQAKFWEDRQKDSNLLISGEYLYEARGLLERRRTTLNSNVVSFINESLDKERQQLTGGANKQMLAKQWLERIDRMIQQEKISESIAELKKFDEYFPNYPDI